jgi:hypothetical protein
VPSPITIQGTGVDHTIIERDADAPLFRILHVGAEGVLQLEGLTLRGGVAEAEGPFGFDGGGVLNFGDITIRHSRLTNNSADSASGGLANHGGAVTIAQSVVADNRADGGGGLASFDGTVEITESRFLDNDVGHPGGGFWNCRGTATIATSTFARNGADGAAIVNEDCSGGTLAGAMTIVSTTIADSFGNSVGRLRTVRLWFIWLVR